MIIKFHGRRRMARRQHRPREPRIKQGLRMRDAAFRVRKGLADRAGSG